VVELIQPLVQLEENTSTVKFSGAYMWIMRSVINAYTIKAGGAGGKLEGGVIKVGIAAQHVCARVNPDNNPP
jgi:hypothetical protein